MGLLTKIRDWFAGGRPRTDWDRVHAYGVERRRDQRARQATGPMWGGGPRYSELDVEQDDSKLG